MLEQDYPNIDTSWSTTVRPTAASTSSAVTPTGCTGWIAQENAGQVAAINRGFERTGGDLMAYVNSDDTLLPGAVSEMVADWRLAHLVMVYGDASTRTPIRSRPAISRRARGILRRWCATATTTSSSRARCGRGPHGNGQARSMCAATTSSTSSSTSALSVLGPVKRVRATWSTYASTRRRSPRRPAGKSRDYLRFADDSSTSDRLPEELRPYAREGARAPASPLRQPLRPARARAALGAGSGRRSSLYPRSASRCRSRLPRRACCRAPVVRRLRERRRAAHRG